MASSNNFHILLITACLVLWSLLALVLWKISAGTEFDRTPDSEIEFRD